MPRAKAEDLERHGALLDRIHPVPRKVPASPFFQLAIRLRTFFGHVLPRSDISLFLARHHRFPSNATTSRDSLTRRL
eukprot:1933929-Rhodomonas_salina.3